MGTLVLLGVPAYVGDTPPTLWEIVRETLTVYAFVALWALPCMVTLGLITRKPRVRPYRPTHARSSSRATADITVLPETRVLVDRRESL